MTLILVVASPLATVLVSDRRLTSDGLLIDDESNKAFIITPRGARLVAAFTGLARVGSFETQTWLMDALAESMKPDRLLHLRRLCEVADRDFRQLPVTAMQKHVTTCSPVTSPTVIPIWRPRSPRSRGLPTGTIGKRSPAFALSARAGSSRTTRSCSTRSVISTTVRAVGTYGRLLISPKEPCTQSR